MLVLLIIFMVITPMLSKGVPLDLVKTHNPIPMQAADKSDAVVVSVHARRQDIPQQGSNQAGRFGAAREGPADQPHRQGSLPRADARARYQTVLDVVQNLQAAGVDQLGLLTEQIQEKGKGNLEPPDAAPAGSRNSAGRRLSAASRVR